MSRRRGKKRPQKVEAPGDKRGGAGLRRAAAMLVAVALIGGLVTAALLFSGVLGGGDAGPKTAAIVDQLSLTQPNRDFAAKAGDLLRYAGYNVDYYPGEQVTVDFYRTLPLRDYDVVILRVHSGIVREIRATTGEETRTEYVSLFSGEPYDETMYLDDRYPQVQVDRVSRATYYEGAPPLFGISPEFVKHSMRGRFDNTLVILMGCDGLRSTRIAEDFVKKGASAFVSWSEAVSASHTDAATLRLLAKFFVDGLTLGEAVAQTNAELGPDPEYGAELRVYPSEE